MPWKTRDVDFIGMTSASCILMMFLQRGESDFMNVFCILDELGSPVHYAQVIFVILHVDGIRNRCFSIRLISRIHCFHVRLVEYEFHASVSRKINTRFQSRLNGVYIFPPLQNLHDSLRCSSSIFYQDKYPFPVNFVCFL